MNIQKQHQKIRENELHASIGDIFIYLEQFNKNRHSLTLKITSRNRQQLFIIKVHFLLFQILMYIIIHILSSLNHDYDRFQYIIGKSFLSFPFICIYLLLSGVYDGGFMAVVNRKLNLTNYEIKRYPCYFKLYVSFDFPFAKFLIKIAEFLNKIKIET